MMPELDLIQIGSIIRKVRKGKGLRLEDLADENISLATVSNIERGVPHVNAEKVMYLLEKLGLSLDQIPELLAGEIYEADRLQLQLLSIECQLGYGDAQKLIEALHRIQVDDDHPYASHLQYLKGRCYIQLSQFSIAESFLRLAIHISTKSLNKKRNIEALSYNEWAICHYHQGDLKQALHLTRLAEHAFNEKGERPQFKFTILLNQATYLEKMGRLEEAMQIIEKLFPLIDQMAIYQTLQFYDLKINLLKRTGMYDQAIKCAKEGIEVARFNGYPDRLFDLWTSLGSVYLYKKDWDLAKTCLETALCWEHYASLTVLVPAYAMLGWVHFKKNKPDHAENMIRKAISLGKNAHVISKYFALMVMGDFLCRVGRKQEAIPFYEQALEVSRSHDYKGFEYKALLRLAGLKKGEEEFVNYLEDMFNVSSTSDPFHHEEDYQISLIQI